MKLVNWLFTLFNKNSDNIVIKEKKYKEGAQETGATGPCNYDEAVELTGHGRYNYLQLVACSVISNAIAVDMFGFGVVLAAASCDLKLGISETAILASLPFTGIIYSFPWGYFSDRCGRRLALLLCTAAGFLFATLACFSPTWEYMLGFKLVGYAFSSAGYNLTVTYLGESTGSKRRNRYLFIITSFDLAGELVFYAVAYFILPLEFSVPVPWLGIVLRPWRVYALLLATPLGLGFLLLLFLHESPKFLASRGKEEMALKVLTDMYVANGGIAEKYPVKSIIADNVDDPTQSFWSSVLKQVALLFKPPLAWRTLQLFHLLAICASTQSIKDPLKILLNSGISNFVFVMWYPAVMNLFFNSLSEAWTNDQSFCQRIVSASNVTFGHTTHDTDCENTLSMYTIYCGIALSLVFVTLNLVASVVAQYRRLLLQGCLLVAAGSLVTTALVSAPVASMISFTLVQVTAIGIGSIVSYFVDLYPTAFRGLVTSLGMTTGQLVSLGGINLVGSVIFDYCNITFYGWAVFVCSGIVSTFFLPPDVVRHGSK